MTPERIVIAAIRLRGRCFTGTSHKEAVHAASIQLKRTPTFVFRLLALSDYGFMTSKDRFVGRAEAWKIAVRRRQVNPAKAAARGRKELYSEDLVSGG